MLQVVEQVVSKAACLRMKQGFGLAVLLLLLPQARGDVLFEMDGGFWDPEPVQAHGILSFPPDSYRGVAHARFLEGSLPRDPLVLETGETRIMIKKWIEPPVAAGPGGELVDWIPQPSTVASASWSTLEVEGIHPDGAPQMIGAVVGKGTSVEAAFAGASCDIAPDHYQQPIAFVGQPDDDQGPGPAPGERQGEKLLVAECTADRLSIEHPHWIDFYGMQLLLDSSNHDEPEIIRTGTWQETDETGLFTRNVTQILQVRPVEPPRFTMDWDAALRIQAPAIDVVGSVASLPRDGRLAWGPHDWEGPLDAWKATGHFSLGTSPDEEMTLAGTTIDAPPKLDGGIPWRASPGAVAALVLVGGGLALLIRFAWGLFARIPAKKVLDHRRRAAILDQVRADPGAEVSTVARQLGLSRGVALHHIRRLRQEGFIRFTRLNGRTALFAAEHGHRGHEGATVLLRRETSRNLYEAIRHRPGADQSTLAHSLGITQQRVSLLLGRMVEAGLVSKHRESGRLKYYPATPIGADTAIAAAPYQASQGQTSD